MRFFEPTDEFKFWLKDYAGDRLIVDCGCGDGDLVREMNALGSQAMGIDPRYAIFDEPIPTDLASCLLPMQAEDTDFINMEDVLLLVCRPCHNGFPFEIAERKNPKTEMIYVGFPKNIINDVGERVMHEIGLGEVGADGERAYVVLEDSP